MHCAGTEQGEARAAPSRASFSQQLGSAGSFLLHLKGAEELPQLFFSIIDAAWKGSRVLAGVACPGGAGE